MEAPYMVSTTILYSDGSQTVVNYDANGTQVAVEEAALAVPESPANAPAPEAVAEDAVTPSESEVSDAQPVDEQPE